MINALDTKIRKYMTITEIAEYLGLDYFHAYQLLKNDKTMSYQQYGRKKLWLFEDIEKFRLKHLVKPY